MQYVRILILSERLRNARKKTGLSQEKLARLLDVSNAAIIKWEKGTTPMPLYRERLMAWLEPIEGKGDE